MSLHNFREWILLPTRTSILQLLGMVAGDTERGFCRELPLVKFRSFARADVTKHYRLRGLNNRNSSPRSSEGHKSSQDQASEHWFHSWVSLLDLEAVILFCYFPWSSICMHA